MQVAFQSGGEGPLVLFCFDFPRLGGPTLDPPPVAERALCAKISTGLGFFPRRLPKASPGQRGSAPGGAPVAALLPFGLLSQAVEIEDDDRAILNGEQSLVLEATERSRDQLAHRPDLRSQLLVRHVEREFKTAWRSLPFAQGSLQKPSSQALPDLQKGERFDQAYEPPKPPGERANDAEGDLRMLATEAMEIALGDEQDRRIFDGHGRSRIGPFVEDGEFGNGAPFRLDRQHLLAPSGRSLEDLHRARMHDEESRARLPFEEEDLALSILSRPTCFGQGAQHGFAERREEGDLAQRVHAGWNVQSPLHGRKLYHGGLGKRTVARIRANSSPCGGARGVLLSLQKEFRFGGKGVRDASALVISVKSHSLSIMDNGRFVFSFDRAGRLYTAYRDGHTFIRGLSGIVVEKWHEEGEPWAPKRIRVLTEEEKRAFLSELWAEISEVVMAFRRGRVRVEVFGKGGGGSGEELDRWLEKILAWDAHAYARDQERFLSVYKPISILPPDQYLALVLQVTEGCHWNKCAFCDFYRDRRFRIKTEDEVRRHIAAVKEFLGDSITLRRSLFLADANALILPQERLVRLLEIIHEAFSFEGGQEALEGIYSFLDAYSGMRKTVEDFAALRSWHVKRLYLGVESGHDQLLRFVDKPGTAREALEVVSRIKAAGLSIGVIILIGLGGDAFFEAHVRDTIALLNEMPLDRGDILYLSPLYVHPGSDYEEKARAFGLRALTPQELKHQIRRIREGLRFASSAERPRVSLYDVREFVY